MHPLRWFCFTSIAVGILAYFFGQQGYLFNAKLIDDDDSYSLQHLPAAEEDLCCVLRVAPKMSYLVLKFDFEQIHLIWWFCGVTVMYLATK